MGNASGQSAPSKISINVFLGEETKYIEIPMKNGNPPRKFIIYPLDMVDIGAIESYSNIEFVEWRTKNPFNKLTVLMYTLWLSVSKNKDLGYNQDEFLRLFGIPNMASMFQLLGVVLELSGLEYVKPVQEEQEEKKD